MLNDIFILCGILLLEDIYLELVDKIIRIMLFPRSDSSIGGKVFNHESN